MMATFFAQRTNLFSQMQPADSSPALPPLTRFLAGRWYEIRSSLEHAWQECSPQTHRAGQRSPPRVNRNPAEKLRR